jgi:hypothetical protein
MADVRAEANLHQALRLGQGLLRVVRGRLAMDDCGSARGEIRRSLVLAT